MSDRVPKWTKPASGVDDFDNFRLILAAVGWLWPEQQREPKAEFADL